MAQYAENDVLASFSQELDALEGFGQDIVLEAASRIFDKLCDVPDDFFAPAGSSATARTFYGDGTAYLKLPPFVSTPAPTVAIPGNEYTVDAAAFTVMGNSLVFLPKTKRFVYNEYGREDRFTGWYDRVAVTVTAKWGFAEVPKDVTMAVIYIAMHMIRTADPANTVISGTERTVSPDIPVAARVVADLYKAKYGQSVVFA